MGDINTRLRPCISNARCKFRELSQEFATYPSLEEVDAESASSLAREISRKKKKQEPGKLEETLVAPKRRELAAVEADRETKPETPTRSPARRAEIVAEEEEEETVARLTEEAAAEGTSRAGKILAKVCAVQVCKPEICCADMEGKIASRLRSECESCISRIMRSARSSNRHLGDSRSGFRSHVITWFAGEIRARSS